MKTFKDRTLPAVIGFILGILCTLLVQKWFFPVQAKRDAMTYNPLAPNNNLNALDEALEDEDLTPDGDDPFEEMRKMRERMLRPLKNGAANGKAFDQWYQNKVGGGDVDEVSQHEDEDFLYYDLKIEGLAPEQVKVRVTDGQLHISGKTEKKTQMNGLSTFQRSSFERTFPVPARVNTEGLKIIQGSEKVTLQFPKTKSNR